VQLYNFALDPANVEPSGSINFKHVFFRKNYVEKTFSLLNDDYKDEFKKNNMNDCVSHSKDQIIYVLITFDTLLIRTQFELPFAH
jgi:hypothetical protein